MGVVPRVVSDVADCFRVDALSRASDPGTTDWEAVLRVLHRDGLSVLVEHGGAQLQGVPPELAARVAAWARSQVMRYLALTAELFAALEILDASGIRTLAIKGAALSALAYGDPSVRASSDVDLLVSPADHERARQALVRGGYRPAFPMSAGARRINNVHHCEIELRRGDGPDVDLHWQTAPSFFFQLASFDELYARSQQVPVSGRPVRTISLPDSALLVSLEALKHGWVSMEWAICLDRICRRDDFDLDDLLRVALASRAQRPLAAGLLISGALLGTPVPGHVPPAPASGSPVLQIARAAVQAMADTPSAPTWRIIWWGSPSRRAGCYAMLGLLVSPSLPELRSTTFPASLRFLHYLVRPLYLLRKYAMRFVQPRHLN